MSGPVDRVPGACAGPGAAGRRELMLGETEAAGLSRRPFAVVAGPFFEFTVKSRWGGWGLGKYGAAHRLGLPGSPELKLARSVPPHKLFSPIFFF